MQPEILLSRIVVLIFGLVFLVKGSEFFVKAAVAIAKKLGVSEFVIGSNIANIFLILGVSAFVFPISIQRITFLFIAPFMIFMTFLFTTRI